MSCRVNLKSKKFKIWNVEIRDVVRNVSRGLHPLKGSNLSKGVKINLLRGSGLFCSKNYNLKGDIDFSEHPDYVTGSKECGT